MDQPRAHIFLRPIGSPLTIGMSGLAIASLMQNGFDLRRIVVAAAPLVFGVLADQLASSRAHGSGQRGFGANASAAGLHATFLVLLATLAISGLLTFWARRTYPRDVATAVASEEGTATR